MSIRLVIGLPRPIPGRFLCDRVLGVLSFTFDDKIRKFPLSITDKLSQQSTPDITYRNFI
jgi:hypothetical protein